MARLILEGPQHAYDGMAWTAFASRKPWMVPIYRELDARYGFRRQLALSSDWPPKRWSKA
jgi:hypothetical protein